MFPKIVGFPPKSSILIGFSIIFTIHFVCFSSIFGSTPNLMVTAPGCRASAVETRCLQKAGPGRTDQELIALQLRHKGLAIFGGQPWVFFPS